MNAYSVVPTRYWNFWMSEDQKNGHVEGTLELRLDVGSETIIILKILSEG